MGGIRMRAHASQYLAVVGYSATPWALIIGQNNMCRRLLLLERLVMNYEQWYREMQGEPFSPCSG